MKIYAVPLLWLIIAGCSAQRPKQKPSNPVVQAVKEAVASIEVTPEEIAAAEIHLQRCGLRPSIHFSTFEAWLYEDIGYGASPADANAEQATINAMTSWAESQIDAKVRSAYLEALKPHQNGVAEALSEYRTHAYLTEMNRYKAQASDSEAKARKLEAQMASPCHSVGEKQ